jgi:hypothetical protein
MIANNVPKERINQLTKILSFDETALFRKEVFFDEDVNYTGDSYGGN